MNLVDYYWFRAWKIKILVQQSFSNRPLIQSRTIDFGSYYWFRTYSYLYNEVISCFIAPPIILTMHLAATCRFLGKGAFMNYVYKICLFLTAYPLRLYFLWYKSLQKVDFFDYLPPSSCKHSLWTCLKYAVHTVYFETNWFNGSWNSICLFIFIGFFICVQMGLNDTFFCFNTVTKYCQFISCNNNYFSIQFCHQVATYHLFFWFGDILSCSCMCHNGLKSILNM